MEKITHTDPFQPNPIKKIMVKAFKRLYKSIIQKLAFRRGIDIRFPPIHDSMFFFQYPNRSEST